MGDPRDDFPIRDFYVRKDWIDLRDRRYQPALAVLGDREIPGPPLIADRASGPHRRAPSFGVRHQGRSGRCAGFALAALVDMQRRLQTRGDAAGGLPPEDIVSADMLYRMAAFHDQYPDLVGGARGIRDELTGRVEGVRSLRSVIKGFYHHGVCLDLPPRACPPDPEARWQSECYADPAQAVAEPQLFPEVPQAKAARAIGLGAYYRLDPVLNHYHSALNEAGVVLVSANIHRGWHAPFDPAAAGAISPPEPVGEVGTHAVAVIGYTSEGFLVLNSWGPDWGGFEGIAGVALWTYGDWAQNVVDGWVLRLGVSAPSAFDVSIGEQGMARIYGRVQAASVPCYELVGHYMHLDDGFHVEQGSYPSFAGSWKTTRDYLVGILAREASAPEAPAAGVTPERTAPGGRPRRGVLVWLPGSLEGIKPAFRAASARKGEVQALDLYPYTVFWCNNFVEKSLEVLTSVFASCKAQAGSRGAQLDALIETEMRGIGRAFWRDIEQGARRSVHGTPDLPDESRARPHDPGPLAPFFADLFDLAARHGAELHIVAEGAGALVLHEMLRFLDLHPPPEGRDPADLITSLSLIHPAIGLPRASRHILPLIAAMNARTPGRGARDVPWVVLRGETAEAEGSGAPLPARIYVPSPALERRICFGDYGRSILHLVARSFEDRLADPGATPDATRAPTHPAHPPRRFLGMAAAPEDLTGQGAAVLGAFSRLDRMTDPKLDAGLVPQSSLNADAAIEAEVFRTIRSFRNDRTEG